MLGKGGKGGQFPAAWTLGVVGGWDGGPHAPPYLPSRHNVGRSTKWDRFRDGLGRMEGKLHGSRFVFHVVGVVEGGG